MSIVSLSRRLSLLTPEKREAYLQLVREIEQADEAEHEQRVHDKYFAIGQHAALALLGPRQARAIAELDLQYIDDWHPVPAYGWAVSLYAAVNDLTDPGDICRDEVECFAEKFLDKPYPEACEVCAFIEGVQDVVDERTGGE
ncbi:hypothetical protein [Paraburkholderia adhaesiva]|uniref:hypothetical protein n=1 Tax=Paraburkholderia adhaesiva TaxID=2883244 RepID=UPI001F3A1F73|nr:hypothetical protein [Paraburkholderia adhaesiva]